MNDAICIGVSLGFDLSIHGRAGLYLPVISQSRVGRASSTLIAVVGNCCHMAERDVTGKGGKGFASDACSVGIRLEVFDDIVFKLVVGWLFCVTIFE